MAQHKLRQELATTVNQWKEDEDIDKIRVRAFTLARLIKDSTEMKLKGNSSIIS